MVGKELFPQLDPKAPAHLNHMCPLVIRIGFLHRLGATGEDVLKEAPVRPATQEAFTQRHVGGEIHYGVGCEVVELRPKEIQTPPEERVGRQRKPMVDVGGQKNTLTLPRLRL